MIYADYQMRQCTDLESLIVHSLTALRQKAQKLQHILLMLYIFSSQAFSSVQ